MRKGDRGDPSGNFLIETELRDYGNSLCKVDKSPSRIPFHPARSLHRRPIGWALARNQNRLLKFVCELQATVDQDSFFNVKNREIF